MPPRQLASAGSRSRIIPESEPDGGALKKQKSAAVINNQLRNAVGPNEGKFVAQFDDMVTQGH